MATKAKTTNGATEAAETMMNAGTDAVKDSFEKAAKGYDQLAGFSKENVEAMIKSANAAAKGLEALNTEALAFSRHSIEESVAVAKEVMTAKTVQEWFELQSGFTKNAFDTYMGQMTKLSDLFANTARETIEPINGRFNAFVDLVQRQQTS